MHSTGANTYILSTRERCTALRNAGDRGDNPVHQKNSQANDSTASPRDARSLQPTRVGRFFFVQTFSGCPSFTPDPSSLHTEERIRQDMSMEVSDA